MDGRRKSELRRIQCKLGNIQQADGSAFLEHGNTKVLATVYGPHDVSRRAQVLHNRAVINCQFSMATFSTSERKKRPKGDRRSVEISLALKQTFEAAILTELYPQSKIDIYVQILQADGGNRSAAINAATMALIDAGIPMKDFVCACTATYIDNTPMLDINHLEEMAGGPDLTVATLPKSGKIVLLQMDSRLHADQLEKVLRVATQGCASVHTVLHTVVKDNLEQSVSSFAY